MIVERFGMHTGFATHPSSNTTPRSAIESRAGVRSVEMVDDAGERVRFHVFPKGEATIIEQVSAMVHERAWEIEELRVERGQLDEVFRRVTVGEDAPE